MGLVQVYVYMLCLPSCSRRDEGRDSGNWTERQRVWQDINLPGKGIRKKKLNRTSGHLILGNLILSPWKVEF